ncbi:MAG: hypothetical protein PHP35_01055 [Candidatus Colwellbacteria bacterium]|nr:hypothetical protein [Candidatus Colwellbacteria bacterium]
MKNDRVNLGLKIYRKDAESGNIVAKIRTTGKKGPVTQCVRFKVDDNPAYLMQTGPDGKIAKKVSLKGGSHTIAVSIPNSRERVEKTVDIPKKNIRIRTLLKRSGDNFLLEIRVIGGSPDGVNNLIIQDSALISSGLIKQTTENGKYIYDLSPVKTGTRYITITIHKRTEETVSIDIYKKGQTLKARIN